ncbi:MAG TPA: hypothetical protein DCM68_05120 [Verrucomicrobia bacterium]|nr:hypothetical protein [Verrucomicrobiota bacterium]
MKRKSFDQSFERGWLQDTTRTPEQIRADIQKQEGKQAEAIKFALELTSDNRRRNKVELRKPYEKLTDNPASQVVIAKHRQAYDSAAAKIAELEKELVLAEGVRA